MNMNINEITSNLKSLPLNEVRKFVEKLEKEIYFREVKLDKFSENVERLEEEVQIKEDILDRIKKVQKVNAREINLIDKEKDLLRRKKILATIF